MWLPGWDGPADKRKPGRRWAFDPAILGECSLLSLLVVLTFIAPLDTAHLAAMLMLAVGLGGPHGQGIAHCNGRLRKASTPELR